MLEALIFLVTLLLASTGSLVAIIGRHGYMANGWRLAVGWAVAPTEMPANFDMAMNDVTAKLSATLGPGDAFRPAISHFILSARRLDD